MRHSNSRCSRICFAALLALWTAAFSAPSLAQATVSEAQALLAQGQRSQALEKIERVLASTPKDRQARFLKGVILAEMSRLDDAANVFTKLTEEAPELPEPYNNLAVIYAQQKQFDKAKAALEMAIRTHPSYAVAHENLGDLYAKMARQAYDRALQIDSSNTNAQAKLNLLRDISVAATRQSSTPASKPVIVAAASAASSSSLAAKPVVTPASPATPVTAATPVQASEPAKPSAAQSSSAAPGKNASKDVLAAVEAWAAAWSSKNTKAYLAAYAKNFEIPGGKSRKAWEEERIQRIDKPGNIKVSLSEIDIKLDGERASVRFKQNYQSTNFKSASGKTLEMLLQNGKWQIQQERIGR